MCQFNTVNRKLKILSVAHRSYEPLMAFLKNLNVQADAIFNDTLSFFKEVRNFECGMVHN